MAKQGKWWGGYLAVVLAMAVGVVWLWAAPIGITLVNTEQEIACAPLNADRSRGVDLIPDTNEINEWVSEMNYVDLKAAFANALVGLHAACEVERENRATAVQLVALSAATIAVVGFVFIRTRRWHDV